jgi:TRAP-type mannitol/chloroaromatic compound transport system substrate-binding protein
MGKRLKFSFSQKYPLRLNYQGQSAYVVLGSGNSLLRELYEIHNVGKIDSSFNIQTGDTLRNHC